MGLKKISILSSFFDECEDTLITWLGMAGALINSRGTIPSHFTKCLLIKQTWKGCLIPLKRWGMMII